MRQRQQRHDAMHAEFGVIRVRNLKRALQSLSAREKAFAQQSSVRAQEYRKFLHNVDATKASASSRRLIEQREQFSSTVEKLRPKWQTAVTNYKMKKLRELENRRKRLNEERKHMQILHERDENISRKLEKKRQQVRQAEALMQRAARKREEDGKQLAVQRLADQITHVVNKSDVNEKAKKEMEAVHTIHSAAMSALEREHADTSSSHDHADEMLLLHSMTARKLKNTVIRHGMDGTGEEEISSTDAGAAVEGTTATANSPRPQDSPNASSAPPAPATSPKVPVPSPKPKRDPVTSWAWADVCDAASSLLELIEAESERSNLMQKGYGVAADGSEWQAIMAEIPQRSIDNLLRTARFAADSDADSAHVLSLKSAGMLHWCSGFCCLLRERSAGIVSMNVLSDHLSGASAPRSGTPLQLSEIIANHAAHRDGRDAVWNLLLNHLKTLLKISGLSAKRIASIFSPHLVPMQYEASFEEAQGLIEKLLVTLLDPRPQKDDVQEAIRNAREAARQDRLRREQEEEEERARRKQEQEEEKKKARQRRLQEEEKEKARRKKEEEKEKARRKRLQEEEKEARREKEREEEEEKTRRREQEKEAARSIRVPGGSAKVIKTPPRPAKPQTKKSTGKKIGILDMVRTTGFFDDDDLDEDEEQIVVAIHNGSLVAESNTEDAATATSTQRSSGKDGDDGGGDSDGFEDDF